MTTIFIEDKSDGVVSYFLKALIEKIELHDKFKEFISTGGKDKLFNDVNLAKLKDNTRSKTSNLIIFDADSIEKDPDNGGFEKRKKQIEGIKSDFIKFELFLFPNNKDEGDFEVLLENIINPNHKVLLDCFKKYETCISKGNSDKYQKPIRKAKMYSYIDAFKKPNNQNQELKKGNYFFNNSEYWDLDNAYLNPLQTFLKRNIK